MFFVGPPQNQILATALLRTISRFGYILCIKSQTSNCNAIQNETSSCNNTYNSLLKLVTSRVTAANSLNTRYNN